MRQHFKALDKRERLDFAECLFHLLLNMQDISRAGEIEVAASEDDCYVIRLFAPDELEPSGWLTVSFASAWPWSDDADREEAVKPYRRAIKNRSYEVPDA